MKDKEQRAKDAAALTDEIEGTDPAADTEGADTLEAEAPPTSDPKPGATHDPENG